MTKEKKIKCPKCGSTSVREYDMNYLHIKEEGMPAGKQNPNEDKIKYYSCWDCNYEWNSK